MCFVDYQRLTMIFQYPSNVSIVSLQFRRCARKILQEDEDDDGDDSDIQARYEG
jgi:hypothetical protein